MALSAAAAGIISGAIAAAGNIASSAIGGKVNVKKNKKLMKYQNDLAMQNWWTQTMYNNPTIQMRLAKQAGINPYSIAGNAVSGSSAGSTPAPQALSGGDDFGNALSGLVPFLQNSMTWLQELRNKRKEGDNLDAMNNKLKAETEGQNIQNATNTYIYTHNLPFTTKKLENEVKNLAAQNILLSLQGQNQAIRNQIDKYTYDEIMPLQKVSMELSNRMSKYNADFLQPAQLAESLSRTGLNKANTAKSYHEISKIDQEIDNLILQGKNVVRQGDILDIQKGTELNRSSYYRTVGTKDPGDIKMFGFPIGALFHLLGRSSRFSSSY